jgi:hypothetical protein
MMTQYSVQLASLLLFFATFASGVAIGMEKESPETAPQFMGGDVGLRSFVGLFCYLKEAILYFIPCGTLLSIENLLMS